ncbi:MAG: 3-dehydroquinate synthase [Bacilli bacterium]|nr:3-dehydroquinate synthase [Bacilli bacterium]
MKLNINVENASYEVVLGTNILRNINEYYDFSKHNKVLIVSDDGVPSKYAEMVKSQLSNSLIYVFEHGESHKNIETFIKLQETLLEYEFTKSDLLIALGGGVVGDLVGFTASTYKRGIKYINIPTTTLSQIDSSVGGKTAIDMGNVKNAIGTIYQPELVLIDFDTLKTLDKYQYSSGLVEALKAGILKDSKIIDLFADLEANYQEIIYRALVVKKEIVEEDVFEQGNRKQLNLGHTIGHPIELLSNMSHGEAVGIGMLYVIKDEVLKEKAKKILSSLGLRTTYEYDLEKALNILVNDKKANNKGIQMVFAHKINDIEFVTMKKEDIKVLIEEGNL